MKINFEQGFKRIIIVISILFLFYAAGCIAQGDKSFETIICTFVVVGIIWGIYYTVKWIIKGFTAKE